MFSSKWNYMAVGFCAMGAIIGAVGGSLPIALFNLALGFWNWHTAEAQRYYEELALLHKHGVDIATLVAKEDEKENKEDDNGEGL